MKKFFVFSVAILMSLSFVGCGSEEENSNMNCGTNYSDTHSVVVFDKTEFSPDEAYATVYYGYNVNKNHWDIDVSEIYSFAFFTEQNSQEYYSQFATHQKENYSKVDEHFWCGLYDWDGSVFEDALTKPLHEMCSIRSTESPVYFLHHDKGKQTYLTGTYEYERETIWNTGILKSLKFKYSERVKLPEEFFEKDEGDFSFIYRLQENWVSGECEWFNTEGSEDLNAHYKKKDGKITLDRKIMIDWTLENVSILNLEE